MQSGPEESLLRAARAGDLDLVYLLCSSQLRDADICSIREEKSRTALHYACLGEHCNVVCLEFLILRCKQVDLVDLKGKTPLTLSAKRGNIQFTEVLLKYGADPRLKTHIGNTYAISMKYIPVSVSLF